MKYTVNEKTYIYNNQIKDNIQIRHSFNELSLKTFNLSFEEWYKKGYWKDKYIPYVLLDNSHVVANVSVNIIDCVFLNQAKRYIQIGTVMTEESFRNQGLSKLLIQKILDEWLGKCDGIYLYANDSVKEFYPRFGFKKANEYQYYITTVSGKETAVKLNMNKDKDIKLLLDMYKKGNPFSFFSMVDNEGLLMFYCGQFMRDNVYYCPEYNAVLIAEFEGDTMICYDIFGENKTEIYKILNSTAKTTTTKIIFGFTPKQTKEMQSEIIKKEDTTFFWHSTKDCIFDNNKMMFPLLSHA